MKKFPFKFIDLTHVLTPQIPSWNGKCGFHHTLHTDYDEPNAVYKIRTHQIKMHEGIGTHMDAPAHFIPGGQCIDDLKLEDLIVPCLKIDVSQKVHEKYTVSEEDIVDFESQRGVIPSESFIIIYTGWDQYWNDPEKYRNELVFPSISLAAANFLLARNIKGVGIDTLSPDRPENGFPVHQALLGAGKYIVENVANAQKMPVNQGYISVFPLNIQGGTEAPVRLVGWTQT